MNRIQQSFVMCGLAISLSICVALPHAIAQGTPSGATGVKLPAGHPDISQMTEAHEGTPATTQPRANLGKVLLRAVQTTPNAPPVGADDFVAEFYVKGRLLERIEGKLDANGAAEVGLVPLPLEPQPVIRVTHAGAVYERSGAAMDPANPLQTIEIPVYETTNQAPAWQVRMRHVMVKCIPGGLSVAEMIAVENPSDRAWVGRTMPKGRNVTFEVDLPEGAHQIELISGLNESSTRIEGIRLTNFAPIVPGTSQYQIGYILPAKNGAAEITVVSPVAVQNLLVFLPEDETSIRADGIALAGTTDMGNGKTRYYKASDVPADNVVKLVVSGIADGPKAARSVNAETTDLAKYVAGAGGAITLVITIALLFIKRAPKPV